MIHVSFQISEKEFKQAIRGLLIPNRIGIYAVIACSVLLVNLMGINGLDTMAIWSRILLPVFLIVIIMFIIGRLSSSRSYKQTSFSKGELKYIFNEDVIEYDAPDSSGNLKWSTLKKFKETKEFFYLYTTSFSAIIIPKRAFNSESDLNAFKSLVVSKKLLKR
jgi:hypothetical protein